MGNLGTGTNIPRNNTIDKTILPLFLFRPDLISTGSEWWLRDVASSTQFVLVGVGGNTNKSDANNTFGVRPCFGVTG